MNIYEEFYFPQLSILERIRAKFYFLRELANRYAPGIKLHVNVRRGEEYKKERIRHGFNSF